MLGSRKYFEVERKELLSFLHQIFHATNSIAPSSQLWNELRYLLLLLFHYEAMLQQRRVMQAWLSCEQNFPSIVYFLSQFFPFHALALLLSYDLLHFLSYAFPLPALLFHLLLLTLFLLLFFHPLLFQDQRQYTFPALLPLTATPVLPASPTPPIARGPCFVPL